jgi:hypothetical protein
MKIGSVMMMLLFVGLIVGTVVTIFEDVEVNYPEINATEDLDELTGTYSYSDAINSSMSSIKVRWESFGDANTAWEKFTGLIGMVPIPFALMLLPGKIIISSLNQGISFISHAGAALNIPVFVINLGVVALLVGIVLALVNWWHSREKM